MKVRSVAEYTLTSEGCRTQAERIKTESPSRNSERKILTGFFNALYQKIFKDGSLSSRWSVKPVSMKQGMLVDEWFESTASHHKISDASVAQW